MAAQTIDYSTKSNNTTSPVADTEKWRAEDANEVKVAVNQHASQIDTNESDIATNTGNISTNTSNISTNTGNISTNAANILLNTGYFDPVSGTGSALDVLTKGVKFYGETTALSGATMTLGTTQNGGQCIVRHNHTSAPTITGATARNDFATNYSTGNDNFIMVWRFGSTVYYWLI